MSGSETSKMLIHPDDRLRRRKEQRVNDVVVTLLRVLHAVPPELRAPVEAAAREAFESALEQLLPDEQAVIALKVRTGGGDEMED